MFYLIHFAACLLAIRRRGEHERLFLNFSAPRWCENIPKMASASMFLFGLNRAPCLTSLAATIPAAICSVMKRFMQ